MTFEPLCLSIREESEGSLLLRSLDREPGLQCPLLPLTASGDVRILTLADSYSFANTGTPRQKLVFVFFLKVCETVGEIYIFTALRNPLQAAG